MADYTVYWNPMSQTQDHFVPNADVDFEWGTARLDHIVGETIYVEGGSNVTTTTFDSTNLVVNNSGYIFITGSPGLVINNLTISGGGKVIFGNSVTIDNLSISGGSKLEARRGLTLNNPIDSNMSGSIIKVDGALSVAGETISATGDISYIWNTESSSGSQVIHNADPVPCFLEGTKVLTSEGPVKVEDLTLSSKIACYDPNTEAYTFKAPIWIGSSKMVVNPSEKYPDFAGYPVRIVKGALTTLGGTGYLDGGQCIPSEDLRVTPEHCILVDGHLVPIRTLVNGNSIRYEMDVPEYQYFHIKLPKHEIIVAEDTHTESYLDTGHCEYFFDQSDRGALHLDGMCAPLGISEEFLIRVRTLTGGSVDRASYAQEFRIPATEDIKVSTDLGEVSLTREVPHLKNLVYLIPEGSTKLHIRSETARPCDLIGLHLEDRRDLGVYIDSLSVFGGTWSKRFDFNSAEVNGFNGDGWSNGHIVVEIPKDSKLVVLSGVKTLGDDLTKR